MPRSGKGREVRLPGALILITILIIAFLLGFYGLTLTYHERLTTTPTTKTVSLTNTTAHEVKVNKSLTNTTSHS